MEANSQVTCEDLAIMWVAGGREMDVVQRLNKLPRYEVVKVAKKVVELAQKKDNNALGELSRLHITMEYNQF